VPAVKQPRNSFKDILEVCEFSLKGEQSVTKSIYNIVKIAEAEGDMASVDFLRFFVDEQREEEVQFKRIIDKIKLIGKGSQSLYYIDKEFEKIITKKEKEATKQA
jgi:ferritin